MSDLKYTTITELHICARPGAEIGNCMRDAALLACQEWRNVTLTHNGRQYRVLCNDLIGCVQELKVKPDTVPREDAP